MSPFDLDSAAEKLCTAARTGTDDTTPEGRKEILRRMRLLTSMFYAGATKTGCHAIVEFTGLINEFIEVCAKAEEAGINWLEANAHGDSRLPYETHHIQYLSEKLNCIYGLQLKDPNEDRVHGKGT